MRFQISYRVVSNDPIQRTSPIKVAGQTFKEILNENLPYVYKGTVSRDGFGFR